MTAPSINTSQMPMQNWTIVATPLLQLNIGSPALHKAEFTTAQSIKASDAQVSPKASPSLDVQLFDNAAELKIAFSQFVMHLEPQWRDIIFNQIDYLLDIREWQDDSALIKHSTFITFLRFITFSAANRLPSLGVSQSGNLL